MANNIDWQSSSSAFVSQAQLSITQQKCFPILQGHLWIQTSGSSGQQKWVALSKTAMLASAQSVNAFLQASAEDTWGLVIPDFHVGGMAIRARSFLSGAKIIDYRTSSQLAQDEAKQPQMLSKWNPALLCDRLEQDAVSLLSLVPTQLHDIVSLRRSAPSSLRAVFIGGGYLQDELQRDAIALGWPIVTTYGMTETASQVCASQVKKAQLRVLPHAKFRIANNGEVEIKATSLFSGYGYFCDGVVTFEDPKVDGWFATADLGEMRGEVFRWLGRADRCVKSKGVLYNLDALEVELASKVPSHLRDSFLVHCLADQRIEHEIVVLTLPKHQQELEQVVAAAGTQLAVLRVVAVAEIKRTSIGKLDRLATTAQITLPK